MNKPDDEQRILLDENVIHVGAGFVAKERRARGGGAVDARAASW